MRTGRNLRPVRCKFRHAAQASFTHKELAKKFTELERRLANHDVAIQQLLHAIRQLMDEPPAAPKPKIGFQ